MMDSLSSLGDQLKPGLEQLMAFLKEFKVMIDDFSAKMNGDERITDAGILEDIKGNDMPTGRKDIYKKKAFDKWKAVDSEIKKIDGTPGTKGSMDKAVEELDDPTKTPEEREALLQKVSSLRERRDDLIKKRTVLKERFDALNTDPNKMLQVEEAAAEVEKQKIGTDAVDAINNMSLNNLVKAAIVSDKLTISNSSNPIPADIQQKLMAVPGSETGVNAVSFKDLDKAGADQIVNIIREASLAKNATPQVKDAMATPGDWFGPDAKGFNITQAKDGKIYRQSPDGLNTDVMDKGKFVTTGAQYLDGATGKLAARPNDPSQAYNTETHSYGERTGAAAETKETPDAKNLRYIKAVVKAFSDAGGKSIDTSGTHKEIATNLYNALQNNEFGDTLELWLDGDRLEATDEGMFESVDMTTASFGTKLKDGDIVSFVQFLVGKSFPEAKYDETSGDAIRSIQASLKSQLGTDLD
jgi:hypothetical protein